MIFQVLKLGILPLVFAGCAGAISVDDRVECASNEDCGSEDFVCCRNKICCSSHYHLAFKTRCFSDSDCTNVTDYFTKLVMNDRCCKSTECCSKESYENEPEPEKGDKHFKFNVIVIGTLIASAILIATIVTFWCSSDKNRRRRRSFGFRSRGRSSFVDTSRDYVGEMQSSLQAIHLEPLQEQTSNGDATPCAGGDNISLGSCTGFVATSRDYVGEMRSSLQAIHPEPLHEQTSNRDATPCAGGDNISLGSCTGGGGDGGE